MKSGARNMHASQSVGRWARFRSCCGVGWVGWPVAGASPSHTRSVCLSKSGGRIGGGGGKRGGGAHVRSLSLYLYEEEADVTHAPPPSSTLAQNPTLDPSAQSSCNIHTGNLNYSNVPYSFADAKA